MTDIQVGRGEAQVTRKLGHEYITAGSYFKSAEVAGVNGFPPKPKITIQPTPTRHKFNGKRFINVGRGFHHPRAPFF